MRRDRFRNGGLVLRKKVRRKSKRLGRDFIRKRVSKNKKTTRKKREKEYTEKSKAGRQKKDMKRREKISHPLETFGPLLSILHHGKPG